MKVLHGDIKAHNVIRRDNGDIVLVDLGAGRRLSSPAPGRDMIGTPAYMAPEVLRGAPRSPASDIYSLGVLLFHLVTDTYPVFAASTGEALAIHDANQCKRLRDLRPDLPDSLIAIVERATSADPGARYASAGAMEAALRAGSDRSQAPPPPVPGRLVPVGAMVLAAAVVFVGQRWWNSATNSRVDGGAPVAVAPTATVPPVATDASFDIDAAFYRMTGTSRERLEMGQQVRVDDELILVVQATVPAYLYVVNEDEEDHSFLLFPLPGEGTNPIPANRAVRIPATQNWVVNSVGRREHFLVFAGARPLDALETLFGRLPPPKALGAPRAEPIPKSVTEQLRGVGQVKAIPSESQAKTSLNLRDVFQAPLQGPETTTGLWVRQLTLVNDK